MPRYPFTPAILDVLPEKLAELYRELEDRLLYEICSRFNISGELNEVTVQSIRALRSHGIDIKDIKKAIAKTTNISKKELDKLLSDVVKRNEKYFDEVITLTDITEPAAYVDKSDIDAIMKQTHDEISNITRSMGFYVRQGGRKVLLDGGEAYQWALDNAVMQIQSGAISYNLAISSAIKQLADSGLKTVNYESGHVDSIDVAVRRAVMTGIVQINSKYNSQAMDRFKTDLVEVDAHMGARNIGIGPANHEGWQGKVYRWKEYTDKYPNSSTGEYPDFTETTGYGTGEGLCGWNCRHGFVAFVEGVMEPTYTDNDLEKQKAKSFEFEGKQYNTYTATQKQRQIERTIRKLKRRKLSYEAAEDKENATATNIRMRRLKSEYKAFSKAAGLPEQPERMKVYFADENLDKNAKSDIINSGAITGARDPNSLEAEFHAEQYYDAVRAMRNDVNSISANTGISTEKVQRIKDYLFLEKHWLSNEYKRFDPDYMIAQSWQRLIDGKHIQKHDLTLLLHEIFESQLVQQGLSQDEAHIIATEKYNYQKESNEYYGLPNEYK